MEPLEELAREWRHVWANPAVETWVFPIAGAALCIAGWNLYRFGLRILGFLLGAGVGFLLGFTLIQLLDYSGHPWARDYGIPIIVVCAAVLGLINAFLFYKFFLFGVFVVAAVAGFVVLQGPVGKMVIDVAPQLDPTLLSLVGSAACGLVAVLFHRFIVIILTSLFGAVLLAESFQMEWLVLPCFVSGILIQLGLLRVFKSKPMAARRASRREE